MKNLNFPQKIIHLKINLKKKMATENLKIPTEKVSYEKMFFKIKYVIINTTGSTKITLLLLSKNPLLLGRSKKKMAANSKNYKWMRVDFIPGGLGVVLVERSTLLRSDLGLAQ